MKAWALLALLPLAAMAQQIRPSQEYLSPALRAQQEDPSRLKTEKVVKPPSMPVTRNSRAPPLMSRPASTPIAPLPRMFTASVPKGKAAPIQAIASSETP